jgi:hypothetical protein
MKPLFIFPYLLRLALCAAAPAAVVLSGCAPSDSGSSNPNGAATDLTYSSNPAKYPYGVAITTNKPVSAKKIASFTITPDLPTGLTLSPTTGQITGTPTTITSDATYTVRASNSYGAAYVKLSIAITDRAPTITYGGATTLSYNVGSAIATLTPTLGGGPTVACESQPALPAGLSLSSQCVLSGTPTVAAAQTTYQITATNSGGSAALPLQITVIDLPPAFNYASPTFSLVRGAAATGGTPTSSGGVIASCAASPTLPAGLSLSSGCVISGAPTAVAASASYTVTATNSGGTASRTITLDVHDVIPSLTFTPSSRSFTKGTAVSAFSPANSGSTIDSCVSSPTLPAGLSLSATCVISGTPSAVAPTASYSVTATNSAGSGAASISLAVTDIAPIITYFGSPYTYTHGTAITPIIPARSGGTIVSCTSSPALPLGLLIDNTTCAIGGTPTIASAQTKYTITATNSGGTGTNAIFITVMAIAPNLTYAGSPYTFPKSTAITPIVPTNSGDPATTCASSPTLPAGLTLLSDCSIAGTPTTITATASYVITATNSAGSSTKTISMTITDKAPAIAYAGSPFVYTKNTAITALTPTNTGGSIVSCAVSPGLPTGLSISSTTCVITGTPTVISAASNYTVTATNAGGSSAATINIRVNDVAPSISYVGSPFTYTKNSAITTLTPTNLGGTVVSCAASPALPTGLSLSATCDLTGTPTAVSAATSYTVTATNTGGTSSVAISIAVNDMLPAITYAGSPFTYTAGTTITTLTATNTGGAIVSCASSPALPAGLSISAGCTISGTPSTVTASASYTITAANSAGSASTSIVIAVNDVPPTIAYSGSPWTFTVGSAIPTKTPTTGGGAIVSCASSPTLPAGLSLSPTGCVLSGTPTAPAASGSYTITATNSGGSGTATVTIVVNDVAPVIAYTGSPWTFTTGSTIATKTPSSTGGTVVSCASSPALPTGLSLSAGCVITGTPTTITATASYTITATNTGGTGSATVSITVNDPAPSIAYAGSPYAFTKSTAIASQTPTNSGGTVVSCASSPTLPTGLALSATCVISGTPTTLSAASSYTITATNTGGSASTTISVTVHDTAPAIDYIPTSYSFTYIKNTAITTNTPNNTGGPITACSSSPTLPTGLSLSQTTCAMTGTPTGVVAAASYTISATNSGGTSTAVITITVNDAVPAITYTGSPFTYTKSTAITTLTPTNTGGTIASCAVSPALPAGLSLSSVCVITGTPTALASTTSYTITATNTGGSATATISITVNDVAPTISYVGSPWTFTVGTAIPTKTPTAGGGAIVSCASSPTLPAGLSLSATGCVISGTPTTPAGSTSYTITATNSGGTGTATVSVTVNNVAPVISYSGSPFTFARGTAISSQTPANSGGAITSCSSSPTLPAGLSLSTACVITGTPSAQSGATAYTISATNASGTGTASINVTVNDLAPSITFSPASRVYVLRTAISATSPTNSGGTPTGCTISPALPTGLSMSTACVITGTPTVLSSNTSYTVTATNTGGTGSATVSIKVKNLPVIAYQSLTATNNSWNGTATISRNIWRATQDGTDRTIMTSNTITGLDSISPSWNAAGTAVAYSSKRSTNGAANGTATGSYNLWTTTSPGGTATIQTANTSASLDADDPPVFSPDGTKIAYASKAAITGLANGTASLSYNIFVRNADGTGTPTALTQNTITASDSKTPVWSPDGTMIYFSSKTSLAGTFNGTAALAYNIWRMSSTGTSRVALTSDNTATRDNLSPDVSSDGLTVIWHSKNLSNATAACFNIMSANFDGTSKVALTANNTANLDSTNPRFSTDDAQIVFSSKMKIASVTPLSYNIWTMDASGLNQVALTTTTVTAKDSLMPQYSPDGTLIAFYSKMDVNAVASSSNNIFVMKSDGTGSPTAITQNTSASRDSVLGGFEAWFAE